MPLRTMTLLSLFAFAGLAACGGGGGSTPGATGTVPVPVTPTPGGDGAGGDTDSGAGGPADDGGGAPSPTQEKVSLYRPFEKSVANGGDYANKFTDVTLKAVFTSPSGRRIEFAGFYDGDGAGGQ